MSEWEETTLKEVILKANTGLDAIKRAPIVDYDSGIKCLRIQDVSQKNRFGAWGFCDVTESNYQKFSLKTGDILIARTGNTIGVNIFIDADLKSVFNNGLIRIKTNSKKIYPKYLYYLFKTRFFKGHIKSIAFGTSTQPNMQIESLLRFSFELPPLNIQNEILKTLSFLDAKIENLRRQNETLEAIAQTLFKHWFIDFEFPDADGKPYKSSGGEMVDSAIGDIPEGWQVGTLGDVAKNHSETHNFKGKNEIIFVNTGDVSEGNFLHENYMSIDKLPGQAKKRIAKDDILYSEIRPKNKRFAYVNFDRNIKNYVVSTKFMVIRANVLILPRLLYLMLKRQESIDEFNYVADSRSGTFPQITFEAVSHFSFPLAPIETQKNLMSILTNLLEKKESNIFQIQTITKTRDALLPKLMSGQLRVKE